MVRTTTDRDDVEYTHSVNARDLSVGDAVRMSHADVAVTRLEPFDNDDAPTIDNRDFGYMRLGSGSAEPGHVGGVSAARNAEAVARGDFFDFGGDTIPDDAIDLRAGFVTCDKCDAVADADDEPWASVSVSPHGSNDRDDSFAVSLCGECAGDVAEATGHDRSTVDTDPEYEPGDVIDVVYEPPRDTHPEQTIRVTVDGVAGGSAAVIRAHDEDGNDVRVYRDDMPNVTRNGTTIGDLVDVRPAIITDGGRDLPPLSSYDHAPTIGPADVDKCRECGRYAPHAFDHNPACSRFEPIESEPDVEPSAANNPRMVRPTADGGRIFDDPEQSVEAIASAIVAADTDDRVVVHVDAGEDTLSIYEGDVGSSGYKKHDTGVGGTHVVAIDLPDRRVAVHFDRDVDDDWELIEPEPVLFDPADGERYKVTGFDSVA